MISDLAELSPQARAVAQDYLATAVAGLTARYREQVVADLTAFLCDHLSASSTAEEVRELVEKAGSPGLDDPSPLRGAWQRLGAGFDPRDLAARLARTWWNPADERLFVPRALGLGFDLNFGALAVRLGLIEPDAEAEPFTSTPPAAFAKAAALPAALAAATVLHYAVRGRRLADPLPAHWDVAGTPDRWVSRSRATAIDLATTVLPAVIAAGATRSQQSGARRAGTLAAASAVAAGGAATTVLRTLGDRPRAWAGPVLAGAIAGAAGAVLLGLARAGRAAEIRADLGDQRA